MEEIIKPVNERLSAILEGLPFTLNKGQMVFLNSYISGNGHFTLLGEGGSGKSLVLSVLKKYYGQEALTVALSGVANQNLFEGKGGDGTLHKCLSLPLGMASARDLKEVSQTCSGIFAKSDLIRHIWVDEAFMMNPDMLNTLLHRVRRFNKRSANRSARNIRILLCGDPLQAPAITSEEEKHYLRKNYGHHLMFKSEVWERFNPTVCVLPEVMRQGCRIFKAALEVIRFGQEDRYDGVLKWLNKRVNYRYDKSGFTVACYNKVVDQVNGRVLALSSGRKLVYRAQVEGEFDFKENGIEPEITLAVGLDCITTVNCPEGHYNNGSFCTITDLNTEFATCRFHHTGEEHQVPLHEYEQHESYVEVGVEQEDGTLKDELHRRKLGTCSQISLKQASAFSIHRAQGRTFNKKGVLDIGWGFKPDKDFGDHLLYVGLSRFTDVNLITLPRPLKKEHIKVCRESADFWMETVNAWEENSA